MSGRLNMVVMLDTRYWMLVIRFEV